MDLSRKIKEQLKEALRFKHVRAKIVEMKEDYVYKQRIKKEEKQRKKAVYDAVYETEVKRIEKEDLEKFKDKAREDARLRHKRGSSNLILSQLKGVGKQVSDVILAPPKQQKDVEVDIEEEDELDELVEDYIRKEMEEDNRKNKKHKKKVLKTKKTEERTDKKEDNTDTDPLGFDENIFGNDEVNLFG